MILLDTNVISEAMKPAPHEGVRRWLDEQAAETLYLSTITLAELGFGIVVLPAGARRNKLAAMFEGVTSLFVDRILPFDDNAARRYGDLATLARAAERGFPTPDGYIAAIAASRGFMVATRDKGPFTAAGLLVIDPWVHFD